MIIYLSNGFLHASDRPFVPGLFVVAFIGSYLGKLVLGKVQPEHFRLLVLVLIFIIGGTMLWKALHDLNAPALHW